MVVFGLGVWNKALYEQRKSHELTDETNFFSDLALPVGKL
jgi:hypothetical protein